LNVAYTLLGIILNFISFLYLSIFNITINITFNVVGLLHVDDIIGIPFNITINITFNVVGLLHVDDIIGIPISYV
jgi:hypothetical protein